jgi:hypothetical protein
LHLQPLVLVERGEQETELILKIVQVGDLAVGEVGRFKDKPLGHVTAAPQMIEHNQVADKKTVGCAFKHKSDALGFSPLHVVHHLLDAVQVIHELLDGAHGFAFVDGDVGFAECAPAPVPGGRGRAQMLLGMDAGDAPATSGPIINSSRQPRRITICLGINQHELVGRQSVFWPLLWVFLQNEMRQMPMGNPQMRCESMNSMNPGGGNEFNQPPNSRLGLGGCDFFLDFIKVDDCVVSGLGAEAASRRQVFKTVAVVTGRFALPQPKM